MRPRGRDLGDSARRTSRRRRRLDGIAVAVWSVVGVLALLSYFVGM
ncbi:hypothetical protein [Marinactinospora rubrisoli]|uniref:Uncharacterized protein n=1 Tax=Marinactinospora rubrisoli TaxID=2715399 RepID=A0ABW2KCW2_9ACTN